MKACVSGVMLSLVSFAAAVPAFAADEEEKVSFEVGADVVSSYIWRGQSCAGFSVQPGATVTFNRPKISFGVWASAELFENHSFANMTEFDLSLSYSPTDKFTVGLTDYHFCGGNYWRDWTWNANASHNLELNLSYDFGPLALAWNTCLTGNDYHATGDRRYSSYFEFSAPFKLGGVDCSAALGATPWDDGFVHCDGHAVGHNFNVVNVSLTGNKELKGIPFMGQIVFNPQTEATYFVVGLTF